jgi:GNAT superfamily N-acetyltransferase
MVVEVYTVERLSDALKEKGFWFQNVAPITRHRAQLLINNPRSQKDDPVLFVAKEGPEIIGYRIVFPDRIYLKGEASKIGWGSSFWVNERYRGQGIGRLLFEKSFELWNGNIGSLIQSRDAARVYERNSNFYCFNESIGYQFVIRLSTRFWIQKRVRVHSAFEWIFPIIDAPVNAVLGLLKNLWISRKKPVRNVQLEYCREIIDPEAIQFVESNNLGSLSRKEVIDLNAIVKYPTSLATPLNDAIASRYYFSTSAFRFDYLYFKVYDLNLDLKGLVLMNIEGGGLKLLYYFYKSENTLPAIYDIVLLHAIKLKTEVITSFDSAFSDYLMRRSGFPRLYGRRHIRKSFLPIRFKSLDPSSYKIYDGDGA